MIAGRSWTAGLRGLIAAVVLYLTFLVISFFGMGRGDVKLAALLGIYLGWLSWTSVAVGMFAGFLLGGLFGVVLMLTRAATRKTLVPFGPFMLAGAFLAVFAAAPIAHWYSTLLIPSA